MPAKVTRTAQIIQILDWYESPELLLLEGPKHVYTLAVRSGDMNAPANRYVGGSMSAKRLRDYADGKCDLRFAIAHANSRQFWTFEFDPNDDTVEMVQIKRSNAELKQSIPQVGLFAYDHEDIEAVKSHIPDTIERFDVDGGWDLGEFSSFYSQIEDIYYLSSDIERFEDPSLTPAEKNVITGAFDRDWGGGGSYVAFYRKVANDNDFHTPLRVSGIQYNSPGYVSIHARSEPFENLMGILQNFADNEAVIIKAANALTRFMSSNKMKSPRFTIGMMDANQKAALRSHAEDLSKHLPGIAFGTLIAMAKGNVLVASKVLESIYRRIKKLYEFFDRGRVSHPGLDVK